MKYLFVILSFSCSNVATAQNNIGIGTTTPNSSALLDVSSSNKGLLIPRMTTVQRNAINPAASARALMVFDTDSSAFFFWTGTIWSKLGTSGDTNQWLTNGNNIYNNNSGNVGIGNSNPQYKLDVSGRIQLRGSIDYNNSAGLWLGGAGADSADRKIFIGMRADSSAGFYSGSSDVGWGLVFDGRIGTVGIGNPDPSFPISFKDRGGDKISLYREGSNYYGLGVGNASMQLMTPHSTSDILFGYGRSAAFTENMRVKGNGRVGIGTANPNATIEAKSNVTGIPILRLSGVNEAYQDFYPLGSTGGRYGWLGFSASEPDKFFLYNDRNGDMSFTTGGGERLTLKNNGNVGIGITDPAYKLDVGARMRIRATPGFTAGHWLNNDANNASPAFIGMFSDNQVGFYGSGSAGWGLLMNTQTGAVSFGGNAGQPGQVLTSNGAGAAPTWQAGGSSNVFIARQTGFSAPIFVGQIDIPDLVANFTLSVPSRVLFQYSADVYPNPCFGCSEKRVEIRLIQDIVAGTITLDLARAMIANETYTTLVSGPAVFDFPAGTYSFKVMFGCSVNTNTVVSTLGKLSWQIFPN